MRTWTRADRSMLCGGCAERLARGVVIQLVSLPGVTSTRVRGTCCADSTPPEVPALVEPVAEIDTTRIVRRFAEVANLLPIDWKARSAGEREPGEEG